MNQQSRRIPMLMFDTCNSKNASNSNRPLTKQKRKTRSCHRIQATTPTVKKEKRYTARTRIKQKAKISHAHRTFQRHENKKIVPSSSTSSQTSNLPSPKQPQTDRRVILAHDRCRIRHNLPIPERERRELHLSRLLARRWRWWDPRRSSRRTLLRLFLWLRQTLLLLSCQGALLLCLRGLLDARSESYRWVG